MYHSCGTDDPTFWNPSERQLMEICICIFYKMSPKIIVWFGSSRYHCYSSGTFHVNTLYDMRHSAQSFDVEKPRMHYCSAPSVPVVITCHLPDCCTLLRNGLDEVASRWELALQTQGRDWKVVWGLIVPESMWFCKRHRRQDQLTRHQICQSMRYKKRLIHRLPYLWLTDRFKVKSGRHIRMHLTAGTKSGGHDAVLRHHLMPTMWEMITACMLNQLLVFA